MPIYEYRCRECGAAFEVLVRGGERASCPACSSAALTQELSVFAALTSSQPATAPCGMDARAVEQSGCGRCGDPRGPGSCGLS